MRRPPLNLGPKSKEATKIEINENDYFEKDNLKQVIFVEFLGNSYELAKFAQHGPLRPPACLPAHGGVRRLRLCPGDDVTFRLAAGCGPLTAPAPHPPMQLPSPLIGCSPVLSSRVRPRTFGPRAATVRGRIARTQLSVLRMSGGTTRGCERAGILLEPKISTINPNPQTLNPKP